MVGVARALGDASPNGSPQQPPLVVVSPGPNGVAPPPPCGGEGHRGVAAELWLLKRCESIMSPVRGVAGLVHLDTFMVPVGDGNTP